MDERRGGIYSMSRKNGTFRHGNNTGEHSEPMDRSPRQYSRESLKETMMKHEEIFKQQVSELHQLYRVQKMSMAEMRSTKEFWVTASTSETSHSTCISNKYHSTVLLNSENSSPHQCIGSEGPSKKLKGKAGMEVKDLCADGKSDIELTLSIGR